MELQHARARLARTFVGAIDACSMHSRARGPDPCDVGSHLVRRIALAAVIVVAAAAPSAASAGVLVANAPSCGSESLSQVFLPWLDLASYTLAPGGAAESGDGWSLTGGAAAVSGNEPWHVDKASDSGSLARPARSSATTGVACVGLDHPTLRFFARSSGTGLLSALAVSVRFEDAFGNVLTAPIGVVLPTGGAWTPTLPYVVCASLLPLLPGSYTPVEFGFAPVGAGTWNIDDVYVDPYGTR
jgi:hypothetical protein